MSRSSCESICEFRYSLGTNKCDGQCPNSLGIRGIGLFVNQSLNYNVLEKISNEAFQALWVEISFVDHKYSICGIIYRQHNSPDDFLTYLDRTTEKMVSDDKDVYIMGDFNIDLLKCETSQVSQDFLFSLGSCYLIPTVDKPTRLHRTSATLIDNIFVNNPDKLLASGNIISDISDHFSQFCITTSAKDKFRKNQTQTTQVDHYISDKAVVGCGVPQGSVLGPLLFLLYVHVNDIHRCSNKLRFYRLFADDTNILYADKNLKDLETTVNNELQNLYNWLTANKLTLSIKNIQLCNISSLPKATCLSTKTLHV